MKDWMVRAIKTFVQAFFGILIPEICVILNGGFPESWSKLWAVLAPTVSAALAAAICAVWNIILETMKEEPAQVIGFSVGEEIPNKEEESQEETYAGRH